SCEPPNSKEQAERGAQGGQQHAFGQQLAHGTPAPPADCSANSHLLFTDRYARQQKIGDIGAGNQQNTANGAEQQIQRQADIADHLLEQGPDAETKAAACRITIRELSLKIADG